MNQRDKPPNLQTHQKSTYKRTKQKINVGPYQTVVGAPYKMAPRLEAAPHKTAKPNSSTIYKTAEASYNIQGREVLLYTKYRTDIPTSHEYNKRMVQCTVGTQYSLDCLVIKRD